MEVEYSKVLVRTDIQNRLTIPCHWMSILGPQFGQGQAVALIKAYCLLGGSVWEFRCSIRGKGKYEKPVFEATEWQHYINHMGIQEGDKFILQAEENHKRQTNYIVRVQRRDAEDLWADVQPPAHVAPVFHQFNI